MEHFKIVDETIEEESLEKDQTIENFICDTCGHKSTSGRKLKIHINLHSKNPVSCEDCQKVFNKFTYLQRHRENVHNQNQKFYSCDDCDKKFTTKGNLKCHQKTAHLKVFENCSICHKPIGATCIKKNMKKAVGKNLQIKGG